MLKASLVPILIGVSLITTNATVLHYDAFLDGPSEPTASPGTGFAIVDYDNVLHTLLVNFSFSGLSGTTTAAHIHAATASPGTGNAGVATTTPYFAGFPIGVTSGSYSNTLDLTSSTSWNPAYVTANGGTTTSAEAALTAAIASGEAYLNIHSSIYAGGEIRGFLVPVPEPSAAAMLGLGAAIMAWSRRRRTAV